MYTKKFSKTSLRTSHVTGWVDRCGESQAPQFVCIYSILRTHFALPLMGARGSNERTLRNHALHIHINGQLSLIVPFGRHRYDIFGIISISWTRLLNPVAMVNVHDDSLSCRPPSNEVWSLFAPDKIGKSMYLNM